MFLNKYILLSQLLVYLTIASCLSQDLRGGEIRVTQLSTGDPFFHEATVLIHYDSLSLVNRPTLLLNWGDGTIDTLPRQIVPSCALTGSGIMKSVNTATHVYSNYGSYIVSCTDSFLIPDITNINNSGNEKLRLEAYLVINPVFGYSSSPTFNCQAFSWSCCLPWIYNPFAVDPEGDSLVYQLVPWYASNFTMPPASVDPIIGDFTMSPTVVGKYAVGYQIKELRSILSQSYLIGTVTRLMVINVPSITSVNDKNDVTNRIQIYPNPVSDNLTIEISSPEKKYLSIYNMLGEELLKSQISNSKSQINISALRSGIYFVEVRGEKSAVRKKIIKL